MPRAARIVVPEVPHHVIQRGVRRQRTFFSEADYQCYVRLLGECCDTWGVKIWAYCLMPNHVHLVAIPRGEASLAKMMGQLHRRYAARVNRREDWRGHLWQDRFMSTPMGERHTWAAVRYVENNPVRARLVDSPGEYPWSSAYGRLRGRPDRLIGNDPFIHLLPGWHSFLAELKDHKLERDIRERGRRGLPLGDEAFVRMIEARYGRDFAPRRAGRPRKSVPGTNNLC